MNSLVKSAVGAVLALGAVGAHALGIPATNSSDLVLVIQNETTPSNVYVEDLGITLNQAMSGTLVANAVLNTSLAGLTQTVNASPSATLSAFLAANPLSGDGWAVEGGQYSGASPTSNPTNAATKNPGKAFGVFTSGGTPANIGSTQLATFQGFLGGIQNDLTQPVDSMGLKPLLSATEASSGASYSAAAQTKYGVIGADDRALGATSVALYGLTGNATAFAVQSYILGSAALAQNGTLTFTGNGSGPPVPLPAALWLFGSGLMGLVGISRRRKAAA